jgi:poly(A) polymerase
MDAKGRVAADVVRRLRAAGHETYLAGGCVRDRLLGREPGDYDVATAAPPETVRTLFRRTVGVGAAFGVILVLEGDYQFEVATFRSDDAYIDGRRPSAVHFGTAEKDAQRRDFTVNALFEDPESGRVIDFVGGVADLRTGVIRAIGDASARIREDRLRMLRAVRFAARFGWAIEPATLEAIRLSAPSVVDMAAERIGDEIVKMLTEGCARRAFELLESTGLLSVVLPEIARMKGVEQSADYHPEGDVWTHTLLLLDQIPAGAPETLALGCLLHDVGKPVTAARRDDGRITFYGHTDRGADMAVDVVQRLKRSRETWERVDYLVRNHLRLVSAPEMRLSTLKRMLAEDGFDELLWLARLDALAASGDLQFVMFCERRRKEIGEEAVKPPRLLTGHDLIAMGFEPGRSIGETLRALETAQLEGEVASREDALEWVARVLRTAASRPSGN